MSNIAEIEKAIERLSPQELQALRAWLAERDTADCDQQIEADAAAGKLDALGDEAIREVGEGRRIALNEWMTLVRQRADRYPPGFVADDSRESIYGGRRE